MKGFNSSMNIAKLHLKVYHYRRFFFLNWQVTVLLNADSYCHNEYIYIQVFFRLKMRRTEASYKIVKALY